MATIPATHCDGSSSPLLSLPAEVRLRIYRELLTNPQNKFLTIGITRESRFDPWKPIDKRLRRSRFRFSAYQTSSRSAPCTYAFMPDDDQVLHPAIIYSNRQIYSETIHTLYSSHIFNFKQDIECIIPFLRDLTPSARATIQHLSFTKGSLPYATDSDLSEWRSACAFISQNLNITSLHLIIMGGVLRREGQSNTDTKPYSREEIAYFAKLDHLSWAQQLSAIKGLKELNVKAVTEYCPTPQSAAMSFFVRFSGSIETTFAQYLKDLMMIVD